MSSLPAATIHAAADRTADLLAEVATPVLPRRIHQRLPFSTLASHQAVDSSAERMHALAELARVLWGDVSPSHGNAQSRACLEERAVRGLEAIARIARAAAESLCDIEPDAIESTSKLTAEIPIASLNGHYHWARQRDDGADFVNELVL
jgi:hypothetical protein